MLAGEEILTNIILNLTQRRISSCRCFWIYEKIFNSDGERFGESDQARLSVFDPGNAQTTFADDL